MCYWKHLASPAADRVGPLDTIPPPLWWILSTHSGGGDVLHMTASKAGARRSASSTMAVDPIRAQRRAGRGCQGRGQAAAV